MEVPGARQFFGWEDPVEALQRIFSSPYGPRVRTALIYVLEGAGYRQAARLAGLKCHGDVHRATRKLGLEHLHRSRRIERESMQCSKRDGAAIEATLRGDASTKQVLRALRASSKRVARLDER